MRNKINKVNSFALILILGILICSLLSILFLGRENGKTAEISVDGKTVLILQLSQGDEDISLGEFQKNVTIRLKNHRLAFLNSDCPNKTCVKGGFINKKGQTLVCLPNRVAITIR